ncbi:MAG: BrnA antitoxin family protein [Magnetococcales bacterium]|nr:BrnA antitoxin family protein [Magnetococcales bacterium]
MNGKLPAMGTDLAKVDAHVIQPEEYDELPEWTEEMFAAAQEKVGGQSVPPGQPAVDGNKISTTIRLDADVITAFRASGKGWQTRMNNALRDWLQSHSPA